MAEYYAQYGTGRTDDIISEAQQTLDDAYDITDSFFLNLAADISEQNVNKDGSGNPNFSNIEGGPFAAVIVWYEGGLDDDGRGIGKPTIIGVGANHVVPENDPSAHGEMSAIRDATERIGYSDLSKTVMFTSCECCPQCQASISGAGISRVVFANNRFQAAEIGFSDAEQYRHMNDIYASMVHIDSLSEKNSLLEKLGEHGAVIIDGEENIIAHGDADLTSHDPMASLPSMNAIRNTCKKVGNFHLPDDYTLLTRDIIHPAAFTTADWARIGRIRDPEYPDDPEKDTFEKDASKIIFVNKKFEEMQVKDEDGEIKTVCSAEDIIKEIQSTPEERTIVKTERTADDGVLKSSVRAFEQWQKIIGADTSLKY